MNTSTYTVTSLIAEASQILEDASYRFARLSETDTWKATEARVYEDAYSIVCIAVYETWTDLSLHWRDDQSSLADLISNHFNRTEAKAWDGYLVLLTPSVMPATERQQAVEIRRNTLHVRKLLAAGEELATADAVRRTLLPLLPLDGEGVQSAPNVLDTLPSLLASHGVDEEAARVAVDAFLNQQPITDAVHKYLARKKGQ